MSACSTVQGSSLNIPYSDSYCLGHAFTGTIPHLPDADVLLLLDTDVPWIDVADNAPRPGAKLFLVGNDPLKRNHGWTHVDADMVCIADVETVLAQLLAAARATSSSLAPEKLEARQAHVATPREVYPSLRAAAKRTLARDGGTPLSAACCATSHT